MMSRCTLSGCVVKFETPLRLNTSLLLGLRKHASAELPGGSCEYHGDLPFFFAGSRGKTMWIWRFCVASDW